MLPSTDAKREEPALAGILIGAGPERPVVLSLDESLGRWSLREQTGDDSFRVLVAAGIPVAAQLAVSDGIVEWQGRSIRLGDGQQANIAAFEATLQRWNTGLATDTPPAQARPASSAAQASSNRLSPAAGTTAQARPASRAAQAPSNRLSPAAGTTASIAGFVLTLAVILGVVGVIAGIVVAARGVEVCSASGFRCEKTYPNVAWGLGLAAASVFQSSVVVMIASYIKLRATTPS